jgi:membrane-associated protein
VADLSQLFSVFAGALAGSPWALVVLAAILVIDGFFPFVPGETAVVTLATFGVAGVGPHAWQVFVVATIATMVGDGIAFIVGRTLGTERWRWMRRPRVTAAFGWAQRGLLRRPALFLMTAKFVPFVRVVVTMTAGASELRVRRYLPISFVASVIYTGYHVVIAVFAGTLFSTDPLLGSGAAIVVVLLFGLLFEFIGRLRIQRRSTAEPVET